MEGTGGICAGIDLNRTAHCWYPAHIVVKHASIGAEVLFSENFPLDDFPADCQS